MEVARKAVIRFLYTPFADAGSIPAGSTTYINITYERITMTVRTTVKEQAEILKNGHKYQTLKNHIDRHKVAYSLGSGVAIAGITYVIMKGVVLQHIDRGISVVADRGISVIADRSVVKNNVFLISSRRQGAPSWVIRCLETGGIFSSQLSAAKEMNLPSSEISKHLNGMMDDVRGFTFERICLAA